MTLLIATIVLGIIAVIAVIAVGATARHYLREWQAMRRRKASMIRRAEEDRIWRDKMGGGSD